ncbi:hypothetical protein A2392_00695 [Candidatus Kaiserbacteria bacterium RIFOXYB1_FULL_46_14]|uniref:Copper resistance protein D domain-containing protein n=1 Tax=Candidatus Kaiserbacteria bacterium RIFOXYB1_FULL_46_14 TaxID=1798531 RepID=A0A1F6FJ74_9BACT|nr:MAG: hypothetical protein A2392_00695 [Candidatus Kaiserbacteria bacterium RIFOXYB1_FULL_46_14]
MEALHLLSLAIALIAIVIADRQAFAWMTGKTAKIPRGSLHLVHNAVWIGLGGLIASGIFLAYPMINYLIKEPAFIIKMMFVGILVSNGFLIKSLMYVAYERAFKDLSLIERVPLFLSGAISVISWVAAAMIGLFFL